MLQLWGMIYWTTIAFKFHSLIKKTAHMASSGLGQLQLAFHGGLTGVGVLHPLIYCDAIFKLWEIAFHQWESCMVPMVGIIQGMLDWETPVVGQKVRPASNYGSNFSSWETTSLCGKHVWNVRMGKTQLQRWEPCLTYHGKGMWLTCQHMGMWVGHGSSTAVNEKHVWNVTSCWGVRNSHTFHGYGCIHER